ncbi:unnamed protein product, partial [Prorocentrum cordatum]
LLFLAGRPIATLQNCRVARRRHQALQWRQTRIRCRRSARAGVLPLPPKWQAMRGRGQAGPEGCAAGGSAGRRGPPLTREEEEAEGGKEDGTRNAPPAAALFSRGGAGRAS